MTDWEKQRLMRAAEVAEVFGIPLSIVRQWRRTGTGPPSMVLSRRAVFWRYSDVVAYLDEQYEKGT